MADEHSGGASDPAFTFMRHNAALALDMAALSYENCLRLQQLDDHALQEAARLMHETAKNVRQAAGRYDMATLINSLSSAQFHIAAQFWTHWLEALAGNQQSLGACAAGACAGWSRDLHQPTAGSPAGTGVDSYWANPYASFSRIFQTLTQAWGTSPGDAKLSPRG